MYYNPIPTRVWSRVQNQCTYVDPNSSYTDAYIPLTGQTVSLADAKNEMQMFYKGNILQYKGNSARLTKSQRYSQLARMAGPNRTKVFATQSATYTNPNTTGLLRVGYSEFPFPNQIIGAPNNVSGPFDYDIPNPNGCSENVIQDGGTLVCGTYADPCSGEIYKQEPATSTICNLSSASDVPGNSVLCWNNKIQTWFPRQNYTMNNSTSKWPINYKGLVSAMQPGKPCPPLVTIQRYTVSTKNVDENFINNSINNIDTESGTGTGTNNKSQKNNKDSVAKELYDLYITWKPTDIFPVDSFNIYVDGVFYANVKNNYTYSYIVRGVTRTNVNISVRSIRASTSGTTSTRLESDLGNANQTIFTPPTVEEDVVNKPDANADKPCCDLTIVNELLEKIKTDLTTLDNTVTVNNEFITYKLETIDTSMSELFDNLDTSLIQNSEQITLNVDSKFTDLNVSMNNLVEGLDTLIVNTSQEILLTLDDKFEDLDISMGIGFDNLDKSLKNCCEQMGTNINEKFDVLDSSLSLYGEETITSISNLLDQQLYNITNELDAKLLPITDTVTTISSSITDLVSTASSILNKVLTLNNCDCSGCCCCGCCDSSCNCDVYTTLFQSSVITKINEYVMLYVSTINEDTDTYIPFDEFDTLNASLVSLEDLFVSDPSCCFFNVIDIYRNMLKIVKSAFDNKNLAKTTLINSEKWRQDSIILHDSTKLSEFIEALNKSYRIMDLGITASKAMIKPQYKIYHELYGIPPNLAYDPHLMKPILDSLQML